MESNVAEASKKKGKGKGDHDKGKGKGKTKQASPPKGGATQGSEAGLLGALVRLVERASKQNGHQGLLNRLTNLVNAAESGQKLVPPKRKKKKQKDPPRPMPKVDAGLEKTDCNESWVEVVKKKRGKPQPQTSFPPSGNSDKGERTSLRIREQDWPGMILVQHANMLGTLIDTKGINKKFIVLIRNEKELDEVVGIAQGDKKLQLILLMPCQKKIEDLKQKQDFTLEPTKLPFVDLEGKLLTFLRTKSLKTKESKS